MLCLFSIVWGWGADFGGRVFGVFCMVSWLRGAVSIWLWVQDQLIGLRKCFVSEQHISGAGVTRGRVGGGC